MSNYDQVVTIKVPEELQSLFSRKVISTVAALLVVIVGAYSSIYTISADSVGVVLRFGKYVSEVPPGLHFKIPFGVDRVVSVPVKRQLKQEFGFGTAGATNASQRSRDPERETLMVTGDLNSALVEWVIQYRIARPTEYVFKARGADETLRDVSESVMRQVVGDRTVDEVITIGREELAASSLVKMQAMVNKYQLGIQIDQVQLKNVNPPRPVPSHTPLAMP